MSLFLIVMRTLFFYLFVMFSYRLMGKREVGQLGIIDLIVSILIAELVAISIENYNAPLLFTIVPILLLVVLEILFAFISIKSKLFRTVFDGKPSIIICNGKINYKEMIKQRYSLDDLLISLRQKEIKNIDNVEYAFLEPNGKLSVFKYNPFKIKGCYPNALIMDGIIQKTTLKHIQKSRSWLMKKLENNNIELSDVFYAFYSKCKLYVIKKSDF